MSNVKYIATERNKAAFDNALQNTQYGDTIVYHVGGYAGGLHRIPARTAYEDGYVNLVQKKISPKLFEYIAQRRRKKVKTSKTNNR